MQKEELRLLIDRFLDGTASELDQEMLANYYASLQQDFDWDETRYGSLEASEARVIAQLSVSLRKNELSQVGEGAKQEERIMVTPVRRMSRTWLKYAAVFSFLIAGAATLFILQPWKKPATETVVYKPLKDIQPASKESYLTLGDGTIVKLKDLKPGQKIGTATVAADGKLVYENAKDQPVVINTVTVPRGAEPRMIELPDHTLAWVNTASSITYPTAFTGTTREVKMTGQVYYEVAKEASGRKLFAQTRTDRIEVKGTHFDIRAYDDEPFVQTTLFEGSVQIGSKLLVPGDQYENGNIKKLSQTELDRVIAWKNGLFSYDKVDVQTLMRDLGRYYDVDVQFEGQPTKRTFEGKIGRSLTLKEVLEGLQFTELNYRLEKGEKGNRIVMLP